MKEKKHIGKFWIWCSIFIVLGLILRFAVVGYSFSAMICFGIVALMLVYRLLGRYAKKHPKAAKRIRTLLNACICIGLVCAVITGTLIVSASFGKADENCDFIVVLGAAVHGTTPSLSLSNRIDAACEYLSANPDTICIVSGGQGGGEDISEAQCMYNELVSMGIQPERIWIEDQATSTKENIAYSLEMIEEHTGQRPESIGLVSSEYHLFRAGLFVKDQGVRAVGIPGTTTWLSLRINYFLREIAGVWHYIVFGS